MPITLRDAGPLPIHSSAMPANNQPAPGAAQISAAVSPSEGAVRALLDQHGGASAASQTQLQDALFNEMVAWSLAEQHRVQAAVGSAAWQRQAQALASDTKLRAAAQAWVVQNHAHDLDPAQLTLQSQAAGIIGDAKLRNDLDSAYQSLTQGLSGASKQLTDAVLNNGWTQALAHRVADQMQRQDAGAGDRTYVTGTAYLANLLGARSNHLQVNAELAALTVHAAMPTLEQFIDSPDSTGFAITQESVASVYQDLETAAATAASPDGSALDRQLVDRMAARYQSAQGMQVDDEAAGVLGIGGGESASNHFLQVGTTNHDFFVALAQSRESARPAASDAGGRSRAADHFDSLVGALQLLHIKVPGRSPGNAPYNARPRVLPDAASPPSQTPLTATQQAQAVQAYMTALQANHDAIVKGGAPAGVDPWAIAAIMARDNQGMAADSQDRLTFQYNEADEALLARAAILLRAREMAAANPQIDPNRATQSAIDQVRGSGVFASTSLDAGARDLIAATPSTVSDSAQSSAQAGKVANAYRALEEATASSDTQRIATATADYHAALLAQLQAVYPQLNGIELLTDPSYTNWLRYAELSVVEVHQRESDLPSQLIAAEVAQISMHQPDRAAQVSMLDMQLDALKAQPAADPQGAVAKDVLADRNVSDLLKAARNDVTARAQNSSQHAANDPRAALQAAAQALAPYTANDPSGLVPQSVLNAPVIQQILQSAQTRSAHSLESAASMMTAAQDAPALALALYQKLEPLVLSELNHLDGDADYRAAGEIYQVLAEAEAGSPGGHDDRSRMLGSLLRGYGPPKVEQRTVSAGKAGTVTQAVAPTSTQQSKMQQSIERAAPYGPQLFNDLLKGLPQGAGHTAVAGLSSSSPLAAIITRALQQSAPGSENDAGATHNDPSTQTLVAAQAQDGVQMRTFTSMTALSNYVGATYGCNARTPGTADRAAADAGTYRYYDPATPVFGSVTLQNVVDKLLAASGRNTVDAQSPITLRAMPLMVDGALAARFIVQSATGAQLTVGPDGTLYYDQDDWETRGANNAGAAVTEEFGDAPVLDAQNELSPLLVNHVLAAPKPSTAELVMGGVGLLGMALSAFDGEVTAPAFAGIEGAATEGGALVEQTVTVATETTEAAESVASTGTATTFDATEAASAVTNGSSPIRIQAGRWALGTLGRSIVTLQGAYSLRQDAPTLWRDPGAICNWLQLAGDVASLGEGLSITARAARTGGFGAQAEQWGRRVSRDALAAKSAQGERAVNGVLPTLMRRGTSAQHAAFLASGAYGVYEQIAQWDSMSRTGRLVNGAQDLEMLGLFTLGAARGRGAGARANAEFDERDRQNNAAAQIEAELAREQSTKQQGTQATAQLWTPASPDHQAVPWEFTVPDRWTKRPSGLLLPRARGAASSRGGLWLPDTSAHRHLAEYAHPDDETLKRDMYEQLFERGERIDAVYFTLSNGGTMFELSDKGVPAPVRNAGTGDEETDPQAYGARRVQEMKDYWTKLGGNASNLTITVLDNPDFNPFRSEPDDVAYWLKADWNPAFNRRVLAGKLRAHRYVAAYSTDSDPRIHDAHAQASRELRAALEAHAAQTGDAPPLVTVVEEGWYPLRDLLPLSESDIDWPLTAEEFARNNAVLASVYHSQPPGHFPYFGNGRDRVLLRLPRSLSGQTAAQLRSVLRHPSADNATALPVDSALSATERQASMSVFDEAGARSLDLFNMRVPLLGMPFGLPLADIEPVANQYAATSMHDWQGLAGTGPVTPEMLNVPKVMGPRRVETVPAAQPSTRPPITGPRTRTALHAQMARARQASAGVGRQPYQMAGEEEPQWFWLQSGTPYVKEPTLRERFAYIKRADGSFAQGPRRVATIFVTSLRPTDEAAGDGLDLALGGARPWMDLTDARGEATRLFDETSRSTTQAADHAPVPVIYRVSAPPTQLAAAIDAGHLPAQWLDGALMVVNARGGLFHETWANAHAEYAQKPGEPYSKPVRKGMAGKQVRRAAAKTAAIVSASAAGAYAMRWGLSGARDPFTADWPWLINAGLGMFGYRAVLNGTTAVVRDRLANRVASLDSDPSGLCLPIVERQVSGWRATLRGIARRDQDAYALATRIVQNHFDEPDPAALRLLDSAPDTVLSPNSALGHALEAVRVLSYGVNDAAGARVWAPWLHPEMNMFAVSFDSLGSAAKSWSNVATDLFVPIHWSANGSEILQRSLASESGKRNLSYTAQVAGARARGYYRGNAHRPAFVQRLTGLGDRNSVVHSGVLPDGSRMPKPPFVMRLKEHAMAGATVIGMGPFAASDAFSALHAFASGHTGAGLIDLGMVAADAVFARGFRNTYVDLFRANRGMGPNVRQSFIPWLNAPLKGAQRKPSDITKRRLVDSRDGLLEGFAPAVVVGVGMGTRVVLGLVFPTSNGASASASSGDVGGKATSSALVPVSTPWLTPLPISTMSTASSSSRSLEDDDLPERVLGLRYEVESGA